MTRKEYDERRGNLTKDIRNAMESGRWLQTAAIMWETSRRRARSAI